MSELATLARPYAAAVFKRAKETNETEKWSQGLAFMVAVISNKEIAMVVDNPNVSNQRVCDLMLSICEEQVDNEGKNFLRLIIHNKRLALLPCVASIFEAYKAEDEGYVDVDVMSAYPLTDEVEQRFIAILENKLNKKVHMKLTVDASLIGGVLVRAGDRVIDGSIRGRLQHMQKTLQ
jgi:F-type H+-transporting ATPase subunit delta